MKPFRDWTYADVEAEIAAAVARTVGKDGYEANKAIAVLHDYWRDGKGYVGPRGGDPVTEQRVLQQVEPQFTPLDTGGEVIDNVVNALAGSEPALTFPTRAPRPDDAGEDPVAAAMYEAVAAWWNAKRVPERYRTAAAWSRLAARGVLRTWLTPTTLVVPPRPADAPADAPDPKPEQPTGLTFAEALARVELSAPDPDTAHVYIDPDTQARAALFLFARDRAGADGKVVLGANGSPERERAAEVWFVAEADADGTAYEGGARTVCRIVLADDRENARATEYATQLGGALPIAEMTADLLITEPVRRQLAQLNFIESVVGRVVETAGFAERTITNAKREGILVRGEPPEPFMERVVHTDNTVWHVRPTPPVLGNGVITHLVGISTTDDQGRTTLADPNVIYKEPTDPEFATKAAGHRRYTVMRDCKQGHLAGASTAESSGLAYVQARAGFGKDVRAMAGPFEQMLIAVFTAAIATADVMTAEGDPLKGFLRTHRVDVTAHVDPGPLTPEERAEIRTAWKEGLLAWADAVAMLGVEDVEAARQALEADATVQLTRLKAQAEVLEVLARLSSLDAALRLAVKRGWLTEEEAAVFTPRDVDDDPGDDGGQTVPILRAAVAA